ncbi:RING finger domain-containing protein [Endozoicomonas sp. 8E]|uniref:RING finger domain-containing protein n=1 Tax=Endozoicomonas sp. 8E TaxID=3035692 RepID=UPI0029394977|nr:RING finger domain-containing protein [Endozoicomonas sp. 8E]WOG27570.1 RING finger domain-containing protein [Endozoicomonas sp. 8E]
MLFFRFFIAFVFPLMAMVAPLCYSSTIIDRYNPGGHKVRIEINDGKDPQFMSQWQANLLLPEGFDEQNGILCFKAPVVSADSNSIAILVTNDQSNYCYQLMILTTKEQTPDFRHLSQHASKNGTLVRLKSTTAGRPELISVTTDQLQNDKPRNAPLTLLTYSDNMTGSGLETGQLRNSTLTLKAGKLAGIADFPGGGNGGFFYLPPRPPWGGGGGRPSGLFEIDLVILKPVINWLMSIGKDSVSFEEQPSPARLKMIRVNADGSSSEAAMPVSWLDFLTVEQLTDVDFWNTLLQHAATSCPASESLMRQLGCFKLLLERTALKTHHGAGLKAANGGGQPSGSAPNSGSEDESNSHQKDKTEAPEDQENNSPGEGNDGSGDGNNRKNDNGEESEKNAATQNLQVLANQLVAIIKSDDPDAVFKLRQILNKLNMPQRFQVLETRSTNTSGNAVSPLQAILELQRSFYENSSRNRFIEQLIETTSDETRTLNDPDILASLQPMARPLPEAGNNNLMILYKIVLDIIHRVNQSDQQPPIGQFEKHCFMEYFVQLFLFYSNPLELIGNLLGQISDLAVTHEIIVAAQSLTSTSSLLNTFIQFHQHPSFHELQHFLNERLRYSQQGARPKRPALAHQSNTLRQKRLKTERSYGDDDMTIIAFCDDALKVDKVEPTQITHNKCSVCCERFLRTAGLVKTPCNHIFHVLCLNPWLQKRLPDLAIKTCPVCRSELKNLKEKLNGLNRLLNKYGNCHSLDSADRAVKEWNTTKTSHEALYHFVQLCRLNSQAIDDPRYVNILSKIIYPVIEAKIPHDSEINSASFSPDSRRVVTAGDDCTAKIYGHKADGSWEEEAIIRHNGPVKSASFSHDSCRVVTASEDHRAKILGQKDDGSWTEELTVQHIGKVNSASFSTDSHHMVTASEDGTAIIFGQKDDRPWETEVTISHNGPIQSANFSPDGSHVVTFGKDNLVKIIGRSANGAWQEKAIIAHDYTVNSATFSTDSRRMVTASGDGTAIICGQQDDGSWERELTISHIDSDGPIQSAEFSPDGRHVMTVGRDGLVKIYGRQDNGLWLKKAIIAHKYRINSATFSADGCHLVTASSDNTAKIYGEKTDAAWEEEITICHNHSVLSATFSPDSRHVVTASRGGTAKIHSHNNNGSWEEKTTILHEGWVRSATFSANNRFAVTASIDRKAKIYSLKDDASWQKEITICNHGAVFLANFSADSRFLVTTSCISDIGRYRETAVITELWKDE